MYPAARFLVIIYWVVAFLLFCSAVVAGLIAAGVIKPENEIINQFPPGPARTLYFIGVAAGCLFSAFSLLVFCDIVRAVLNTAVHTKEMLNLMRDDRGAPNAGKKG